MFSQAIIIGGLRGKIGGRYIGGSGGFGVVGSAIGGRGGSSGFEIGFTDGSDIVTISDMGYFIVVVSEINALQPTVGFPDVPGGHKHVGRFLIVLQSAFSPHNP